MMPLWGPCLSRYLHIRCTCQQHIDNGANHNGTISAGLIAVLQVCQYLWPVVLWDIFALRRPVVSCNLDSCDVFVILRDTLLFIFASAQLKVATDHSTLTMPRM